jgi:hypothetical protein
MIYNLHSVTCYNNISEWFICGSEDEAGMMVYSSAILHKDIYSFGTLVSDELSDRVKGMYACMCIIEMQIFLLTFLCLLYK